MNRKTIIIFLLVGIFFYFLNLIQMSFLSFFKFPLWQINFSILLTIVICLLEESQKLIGIFCAFWTGLFLDLYFGSNLFGIFTISFLLFSVIIKLALYKYVKLSPWQWLSKIQS